MIHRRLLILSGLVCLAGCRASDSPEALMDALDLHYREVVGVPDSVMAAIEEGAPYSDLLVVAPSDARRELSYRWTRGQSTGSDRVDFVRSSDGWTISGYGGMDSDLARDMRFWGMEALQTSGKMGSVEIRNLAFSLSRATREMVAGAETPGDLLPTSSVMQGRLQAIDSVAMSTSEGSEEFKVSLYDDEDECYIMFHRTYGSLRYGCKRQAGFGWWNLDIAEASIDRMLSERGAFYPGWLDDLHNY